MARSRFVFLALSALLSVACAAPGGGACRQARRGKARPRWPGA